LRASGAAGNFHTFRLRLVSIVAEFNQIRLAILSSRNEPLFFEFRETRTDRRWSKVCPIPEFNLRDRPAMRCDEVVENGLD